ncbi:NB-ARC domain-containing protein [Rhodoferax sp. PAMC 29310]|uniref:NB-ARC domain-containing protein n=1 Tax=Rhodoferax sp. PAMC 29310 TaxID=2822760 RepID=UPI001B32FDF4|nr:NB-ARC domain-containing protein [Rhodoferax sp. PAMC 29310]
MDYITKKIDSKVNLCIFNGSKRDAAIHLQSGLELNLLIIIGYLWNKNFEIIPEAVRLKCFIEIQRPSIGKIVELSRVLDVGGQLFKIARLKDFREGINKYPSLRNEKLGHGFSFDDDAASFLAELTALKNMISQGFKEIFGEKFDFVKITKEEGAVYKGINFKSDGDLAPWSSPRAAGILQIECVYIKTMQGMFLLSPFVAIDDEQEFFTFSYVEDRLAARSVFNKLVKTGRAYFETPSLVDGGREIDEFRRRSSNGPVVNNYENNYRKYIKTDIAKKVVKFLKSNESTVFATLWGHGGVGKTASMQRVCESLLSAEKRIFDYIVFVSAKDRLLNFYTGAIEAIEGSVDSFDQVIAFANRIVFQTETFDPTPLVEFNGRILIVLDDYETFPSEEKEKFLDFVKLLNIGHHKVVLTTRSASQITGEKIEVLELSEDETLEFFDSVLESYLRISSKDYQIGLDLKEFRSVFHELTSGRPLFIFQSAMIYGQRGSISELMGIDLKTRQESI